MLKFYVETKDNKSNRKGPIDPRNGFPTIHSSLIIEASSLKEARELFEKNFLQTS